MVEASSRRMTLYRAITLIVLAALVAVPLMASAQAVPSPQVLGRPVQEAYEKFKDVKDGANADYIPELTKVPSEPHRASLPVCAVRCSSGASEAQAALQRVGSGMTSHLTASTR